MIKEMLTKLEKNRSSLLQSDNCSWRARWFLEGWAEPLSTYRQAATNASIGKRPFAHLATVVNETVEFRANRDGRGDRKEMALNLNTSVKEE